MNKSKGDNIMNGIKVDFITNTIIVTKEFAALASDPTSEEYVMLNLLREENPKMKITTRSRKKSYKEKNPYKGLTYKFMRKFISVMDEENLIELTRKQKYYESFFMEPTEVYVEVRKWFLETYPDYKRLLVAGASMDNVVAAVTEQKVAA